MTLDVRKMSFKFFSSEINLLPEGEHHILLKLKCDSVDVVKSGRWNLTIDFLSYPFKGSNPACKESNYELGCVIAASVFCTRYRRHFMNLTKFIKILTEKLSKTTSKHHNILVVHLNNLIVLYIVVNSVGMFWKTVLLDQG